MSCHPRPVHCTSHINTGIIWFLMLTIICNIYLIVYVDRNKTLYLSYDDLWFVFKNDHRTRIILCTFTAVARLMCDYKYYNTDDSDFRCLRDVEYLCIITQVYNT